MTVVHGHPQVAPPPLPAPGPAMESRYVSTRLPVRRFTVDEYHRMIEQGYFAHDERFELLEGWIVAKMSKNPPHEAHIARARKVLDRHLPRGWHVRVQSAVTTADSEPEPDLATVRGDEMDYAARHPGAADTAIVVEVASSTLSEDRSIMSRIYARAGFPTYWIINLIDRQIEIYTGPTVSGDSASYSAPRVVRSGDSLTVQIGDAAVGPIAVSEFLP